MSHSWIYVLLQCSLDSQRSFLPSTPRAQLLLLCPCHYRPLHDEQKTSAFWVLLMSPNGLHAA